MLEVGNQVKIEMLKVSGSVVKIIGDEVLVKHEIMKDGNKAIIEQWYHVGIVSELKKKSGDAGAALLSKTKKAIPKIELGILPNNEEG